ncbi:MAG: efflux RND transporter periplasmic adaptor subunit [Lewinellaceae bacterium]|nr:efflux RND transporter periplasmic adaptor subunit [Saprospiraceae bacterium]MCB9313373.1 efflux RND transporter periplasmic adaptor subunit [Lewinellaceae bacterium]
MNTKTKSNRKIYWWLGGILLVLIIAVIIKGKSTPKGEEVELAKVERRTIQEKVAASGRVFPRTEVKVSSDVSGEVVELYVEEGDTVKAGQLLAKIDPEAYVSAVERGAASVNTAKAQAANSRSAIEQAKAQKEQVEAQLANQRDLHRRNEQLHKEKVISDTEYEQSLAALRGLEANLRAAEATIRSAQEAARGAEFSIKSAEASLKEIQTNLRRTSIVAPMSGVISLLNVEQGERVVGTIQMAGTEILRIADYSEIEVQVEVSENDILRVHLGDQAEIEVDAYQDKKFKGTVTQIANSASNTTSLGGALTTDQVTNFIVKVLIDPASYLGLQKETGRFPFRPGMSATVEILTNSVDDVLSVPIQSVTTREEKKEKVSDESKQATGLAKESKGLSDKIKEVVFVAMGDTVAMVEVTTGIQDDAYIQVLSGLTGDEEVVSGPYSAVSRKLESGDLYTIKEKKKDGKDD